MVFGHPALSMNSRDNDEQTNTYTVPITIIKGTSTLHRSNIRVPISAYYQSGYVVIDFYEMNEAAIVTISNSTNNTLECLVNPSDELVLIDINEILSDGTFNIYILTESSEVYCGIFVL